MRRVLLAGAMLGALQGHAFAQAANGSPNSFVTPQAVDTAVVQFLPASTPGTFVTLYTAGSAGAICMAPYVNSTDTATHVVQLEKVNGGTSYLLASLTTTASTGSQALTIPQDMGTLTNWPGLHYDSNGNRTFNLINGDVLKVTYATAVTTSDQVNIIIDCWKM